jgi:hypothetical protein
VRVAYQKPLPQSYRDEFDALDSLGTKQTVVSCVSDCGMEYTLIMDNNESPERIADYCARIHAGMGACGQHPGKIVLNL